MSIIVATDLARQGKLLAPVFERLQVLVIDGNRHMRTLLKGVMCAFGIRNIREACDGADAFKELRVAPADFAITEFIMQPLDGIEFTRLVRTAKDCPCPCLPIIMLTGHSERSTVAAARDAGVNEFLVKPISAEALFARVCSVVLRNRPYIRIRAYVGPDRRRIRTQIRYVGPERRHEQTEFFQVPPVVPPGEIDACMHR